MPQRFAIQFCAVVLSEGREAIHVGYEAVVVMPLKEVDEFVDDDVFEAVGGFLMSSRLSQMRRAAMLQVPHFVFICLTPRAVSWTPMMGCHLAMRGAIFCQGVPLHYVGSTRVWLLDELW